jgi:hypothetical protein
VFKPGDRVTLEHVKPWKSTIRTTGVVDSWQDGLLTIRRTFTAGGRYDTLGERKLAGDYGTIEVIDGGWVLRRTYFRADARTIGELFNIQTPAELSPGRVRYTDLEVDVARFSDGRVQVVDEEDLATVVRVGAIAPQLAEKALGIAHRLADTLSSGGDWRSVT